MPFGSKKTDQDNSEEQNDAPQKPKKDSNQHAQEMMDQASKFLAPEETISVDALNLFTEKSLGNPLLKMQTAVAIHRHGSKAGDNNSRLGSKTDSGHTVGLGPAAVDSSRGMRRNLQGSKRLGGSKNAPGSHDDDIGGAYGGHHHYDMNSGGGRIPKRKISLEAMEWQTALLAAYSHEAQTKITNLRKSSGWTYQGRWRGIDAIHSQRADGGHHHMSHHHDHDHSGNRQESMDGHITNSKKMTSSKQMPGGGHGGSKLQARQGSKQMGAGVGGGQATGYAQAHSHGEALDNVYLSQEEEELLKRLSEEPDHPATYTIREFGLVQDFTRMEPIPLQMDEAALANLTNNNNLHGGSNAANAISNSKTLAVTGSMGGASMAVTSHAMANMPKLGPNGEYKVDLPKHLSRWKLCCMASMQLSTLKEYTDIFRRLSLLMPTYALNWIADRFHSVYILKLAEDKKRRIQKRKALGMSFDSEEDGESGANPDVKDYEFEFAGGEILDDDECLAASGFGWIGVNELQAVCAHYIAVFYPAAELLQEGQLYTASMFMKALELVFWETPPVMDVNLELPFDVAALVIEASRLLWLQSEDNILKGWATKEQREIQDHYKLYDKDGQGLRSQKTFELLGRVGVKLLGREQFKIIELIKECDLNSDGYTSMDEFLYILKRFEDRINSEDSERAMEWSQSRADAMIAEIEAAMGGQPIITPDGKTTHAPSNIGSLPPYLQNFSPVINSSGSVLPDTFVDEISYWISMPIQDYSKYSTVTLGEVKKALARVGYEANFKQMSAIDTVREEVNVPAPMTLHHALRVFNN